MRGGCAAALRKGAVDTSQRAPSRSRGIRRPPRATYAETPAAWSIEGRLSEGPDRQVLNSRAAVVPSLPNGAARSDGRKGVCARVRVAVEGIATCRG